jgi:alcohol dehydrogenase
MMQAAVYREFCGPIHIERIPIPACPDDGVVLKVQAVGICRSDWHGWLGHDGDIRQHGLPFVPGHEVSGIVVQTGRQVTLFRRGDRVAVPFILSCGACVYCRHRNRPTICLQQEQPGFTQYGGLAEFLALPRADRNLAHIPENVSFAQAAALGCRFTTAYRAVLQQGRLQASDSIAVFGCGGLGLSCILLAVAQGCTKILAIDVSDTALTKARQLGATHTLNSRNANSHDLSTWTQEIVEADGVDVSIEASGFLSACEGAIHCTRRGGRMIQVGLVASGQQPAIPMDAIAGREIEIVGSHGFAASDLPKLLEMVARNQINPAILIEREVTLVEGAKAIEDMDHGSPLGITMVTKFPRAGASRL